MWSKKKSPWEMRGFHRKWQGRIPFCYGQPIRLCYNIIVPHLFSESVFHVFMGKSYNSVLIMQKLLHLS